MAFLMYWEVLIALMHQSGENAAPQGCYRLASKGPKGEEYAACTKEAITKMALPYNCHYLNAENNYNYIGCERFIPWSKLPSNLDPKGQAPPVAAAQAPQTATPNVRRDHVQTHLQCHMVPATTEREAHMHCPAPAERYDDATGIKWSDDDTLLDEINSLLLRFGVGNCAVAGQNEQQLYIACPQQFMDAFKPEPETVSSDLAARDDDKDGKEKRCWQESDDTVACQNKNLRVDLKLPEQQHETATPAEDTCQGVWAIVRPICRLFVHK